MNSSESLKCELRQKVGSRDARKLRAQGRVPASLQADGESPHLNIHLSAVEFESSRRHHVHLYDLDVAGDVQTAVVRELQWDALGDHLNHVEFQRVQRGVAMESQVTLNFYGQVKEGVLNQNVTEITISCLPSLIPDDLEVVVEGLEAGTHIHASDIQLPEGISLAVDGDFEIAVVAHLRAEVEEVPEDGEEDLGAEGADGAAGADGSGAGEGSDADGDGSSES